MPQVWITKYALTSGIFETDAEINNTMVSYRRHTFTEYAHGEDWQRSHAAALARADVMRVKRIASLKKQITKLEKMSFA